MRRAFWIWTLLGLAGFACASGSGLDRLRADLKQAWTRNANSYHRFLSAAWGIANRALEKQDWQVVDSALQRQGIRYEPEIDVQHVTTSEPIFSITLGSLKHDVRLSWLIVTDTSPFAATRHIVIAPEVQLTLNPKIPFSQFRAATRYPAGTFMSRVLSSPDLARQAAKFPVVANIVIWYDRTGPYISQEVSPDEGFPCQFEAYIDLERGPGHNAGGVREWFTSTSGLDQPLTLSGRPPPGGLHVG